MHHLESLESEQISMSRSKLATLTAKPGPQPTDAMMNGLREQASKITLINEGPALGDGAKAQRFS